jgi:hypothetical protein
MAIVMMLNPTTSLANITGYELYSEALVGSNGDPYGVPGYDIGTSSSNNSDGYVTWDADEETNFQTGPVAFEMDANLGTGADTLFVTGGIESPLAFQGPGSQKVGSVEIIAAAQVAGQVSWSDVSVDFYQGSTLEETASVGTGPQVDTTGSGGTEEQIMVVTPSSTQDDHVVVSGTINMSTPNGTIPGPDDLFCQVFIMPAATGRPPRSPGVRLG